mgnify:CR=1 FL=1
MNLMSRRARGVLNHEREAVEAAHVGDLVAVGDGGGGAAGEGHAGILSRADIRALDMQVAIDETRGEVTALAVDNAQRLPCGNGGVLAIATLEQHARDATKLHRNLSARHAQTIHIDDARIHEHEVCRRTALGHIDQSLHEFDQIGFHIHGTCPSRALTFHPWYPRAPNRNAREARPADYRPGPVIGPSSAPARHRSRRRMAAFHRKRSTGKTDRPFECAICTRPLLRGAELRPGGRTCACRPAGPCRV